MIDQCMAPDLDMDEVVLIDLIQADIADDQIRIGLIAYEIVDPMDLIDPILLSHRVNDLLILLVKDLLIDLDLGHILDLDIAVVQNMVDNIAHLYEL